LRPHEPVYETGATAPEKPENSSIPDNRQNVLSDCLALFSSADPRLAQLIEGWAELPEPVRAGIVAMVKAACGDLQQPN
jgi:hypothetical protein